jgi:hypothetical protein
VIDKARLLAHIKAKADHPQLLVYAVLTGLATAIERGDFDEKEGRNTDGDTNSGPSGGLFQ